MPTVQAQAELCFTACYGHLPTLSRSWVDLQKTRTVLYLLEARYSGLRPQVSPSGPIIAAGPGITTTYGRRHSTLMAIPPHGTNSKQFQHDILAFPIINPAACRSKRQLTLTSNGTYCTSQWVSFIDLFKELGPLCLCPVTVGDFGIVTYHIVLDTVPPSWHNRFQLELTGGSKEMRLDRHQHQASHLYYMDDDEARFLPMI